MLFPNVSEFTTLSIITSILDITIVSYILYKFLMLIKGTRAVQILRGIVILLVVINVADLLNLNTIAWLFDKIWSIIFLALAVVFQPELRRALDKLGSGQFFSRASLELATGDVIRIIDEIVGAMVSCSKTKTGLLLIIERETGLNDYIETGIYVDAVVTEEFLVNIFSPRTPLHDGAAIIRGDRVIATACFLPLTDNPYLSTELGTRHRAAIGISEVSDALALVVSEETGGLSIARDGKLIRHLDEKQLREELSSVLVSDPGSSKYFWQRMNRR